MNALLRIAGSCLGLAALVLLTTDCHLLLKGAPTPVDCELELFKGRWVGDVSFLRPMSAGVDIEVELMPAPEELCTITGIATLMTPDSPSAAFNLTGAQDRAAESTSTQLPRAQLTLDRGNERWRLVAELEKSPSSVLVGQPGTYPKLLTATFYDRLGDLLGETTLTRLP